MASPVFQYTSLYIKISEAKKLPSREMSHLRDTYCVLKIDNETIARTATAFRTLEPFWGEEYTLHVPNEFQNVSVHVYDDVVMGSKVPLGKVMLDRVSIVRSPRGIDKWIQLTPISKDDDVQGEVLVEMSMEPATESEEIDASKVLLTLVEARDLAAKADGKSDPFATLLFGKEQFSTQVIPKTRFPRWKKTFELKMPQPSHEAGAPPPSIKIIVYNFDTFSQNQFMGEVEIDLSELQVGQRYKTWYRLQHHEPKQKEKKKELGSLRLKVQCHEERVLDSQLYKRFVGRLLKSVEGEPSPEGSPMLVMLEEVMTMDRNALGHALVRFYLSHGSVLPFLDALNMREIHQTTVPHTLFRGNSLTTKSFDQFMKIVALPYLHETLLPPIDLICTEHKVVELDVEQVKQQSKARAGGHLSTHSAMKTVESSQLVLTSYLEMIMDAIFSSVDKCPNLLRIALRQLWMRVADRFQDPEHVDVPYLAVTGFLFLRFFVPAILSPKLFALREEHSDQRTERTLKLIAKVLQSVGNLQLEMDAKEACMKPMSEILPRSVERLKTFVQEILQVDQKTVAGEVTAEDGGYIHHLILCKGWLWKRSNKSGGIAGNLQYRKRYFELSNTALTYRQNEKKTDETKSYQVQWIKVVEKLDEGAFHRKHMFQVVVVPTQSNTISLYLQASDVNEQNQWVSAIRKACLTNRDMSPVYHPGTYKKTKWSCCRTTASQEPGCSQCHRGITIGDWRDPLDPDLHAQVIFSQFSQGKNVLIKKYLGGGDDGSASISTRDGSSSPTSLASAGTTSLQQDEDSLEGSASKEGDKSKLFEQSCQDLVRIIEELQWQHAQVHVT